MPLLVQHAPKARSCFTLLFLLPLITWRVRNEENRALKNTIRKSLEKTCSPAELGSWFDPLHLEFDAASGQILVLFPHVFFEPWFVRQGKGRFEHCARETVQTRYGREARIAYRGPSLPRPRPLLHMRGTGTSGGTLPPAQRAQGMQQSDQTSPEQEGQPSGFDAFIVNGKNAFPLAAARQVAAAVSPPLYNPFIICGKSGTGKTHLLRALTAAFTASWGQNAVFSGSADLFAETILAKTSTAEPQAFSHLKALVVDDIQRLAHNRAAQEKIIRLMDVWQDAHKQMVFASTAPPASLQGLEEGLRSRLEVGLVVELKEADMDVRMRFAEWRSRQHGIRLGREQLLLLARRCTQLRHLSGVILKVAAFHSLEQRDTDIADLENILRSSGEEKHITAEDIIQTVGLHLEVPAADMLGGKRQPRCVVARQWAMYLSRELLGLSYPVLGRIFGGKDHSTVMHAIKKIDEMLTSNKDAQLLCTELKKKCLG